MTSTRTRSPSTTKHVSPQQFLKLAKTAPKQAQHLTEAGFTMSVSAHQSFTALQGAINDEGEVDTAAIAIVDEIALALLAALLIELIKGAVDENSGVHLGGGANDEVTVQSSDGGDSPDGGGDTGDGGDGGDGEGGEGADPGGDGGDGDGEGGEGGPSGG